MSNGKDLGFLNNPRRILNTNPADLTKLPNINSDPMKLIEKKSKPLISEKKPEAYHIFYVVDRSGSMSFKVPMVREALTSFFEDELQETLKSEIPTFITFVEFGTEVSVVCDGLDILKADFNFNEYKADMGSTALYDAIGITLNTDSYKKVSANSKITKILVVQSDGGENNSKRFTKDAVQPILDDIQKSNSWTVLFLGEGEEVVTSYLDMGIARESVACYTGAETGMALKSSSLVSGNARYCSVQGAGMQSEAFISTNK